MEKRKYPRVRAVAQYRRRGADNQPLDELRDLSGGGLGVYCSSPLTVGELLDLDLFFPDGQEFGVTVRVAWSARMPEGSPASHGAGLKFVNLDDEARMAVHVYTESTEQDA